MLKMILIINGMTGQETPIRVEEGATPVDILNKLGLPDYRLATVRNRQVLQPSCDVSRTIEDRERLFVFAPMEVGHNL
jgi:sulfur carrier protein ThiS